MIRKRKMKKAGAILLMVALMLPFIIPAGAYAETPSATQPPGSGTEKAPYLISTPGHLLWMSENNVSNWSFDGKYFRQTADIDMDGINFLPIGDTSRHFRGKYNGNGHKISNLYIDTDTYSGVGLFGSLSGSQTIVKNLVLENVTINGSGTTANYYYVGGIAGYNEAIIEYCSVIGTSVITGTGNNMATGGIAGYSTGGTIRNCFNAADVSTNYTGEGGSYCVGGIVGENSIYNYIRNCLNTGTISLGSTEESAEVGAGGITGKNRNSYGDYGTVENTLNLGTVTKTDNGYSGGIIGYEGGGVVTANYYLDSMAANGIGYYTGSSGATDTNAEPETTENLKDVNTYTGWDFATVWKIKPLVNDGYPYPIPLLPEFDAVSSAIGDELGETSITVDDALGNDNRLVIKLLETNVSTPLYESAPPQGDGVTDPYTSGDSFSMDADVYEYIGVYEVTPSNEVVRFSQIVPMIKFMEGLGTAESPFLVTNASELSNVYRSGLNAHYKVTTDIDMNGVTDFVPIGFDQNNRFNGTFDGDNHKITNLTLSSSDYSYLGLFGLIGTGTVENLELKDISITNTKEWSDGAGGIAGCNINGTIFNSRITGNSSVTGGGAVGGIAGEHDGGIIEQCWSAAAVSANEYSYYAGGIAGAFWGGDISDCYNTGTVTGVDDAEVGGIVGEAYPDSDSYIRNCYNTGNISVGSYVGSIVGYLGDGVPESTYFLDTSADEPFGTNDTGNDYSAQAVVKNSAEMQDQNTYLNWDFTTVWSIDSDINSGYPYLPPIFYTVTFDSNGGSMIDSLSVRKNTTTAEPAAPTRAGYSFGGWYSDEDITTAFDFDTPINSDITLYAKWTPDSSDPAAVTLASGSLGTAGDTKITGLTSGTRYQVKVDGVTKYVKADGTLSGNEADAAALTGTEIIGLVNGTSYLVEIYTPTQQSSGGSSSSTAAPSADLVVNGKTESAGTVVTKKEGDKTVTTVALDQQKVENILTHVGSNTVLSIPVNTKADVVVGQLNGQLIKTMETKEAVLEIKTEKATYTLPAAQINIDSISSLLGQQTEIKDIKVDVKIAAPADDTLRIVEDTANRHSYQVVVKPVEFGITCTVGNKTVEVSKFNSYVERTLAVPDGIEPSKITTGIVLNPDGTFSHVPTKVVVINGKYYAKINSLTNSTYSVIWNPVEFADMNSHWAREAVNDMGSRLVVSGYDTDTFRPDDAVTRAEFATIVVKALGLGNPQKTIDFSDVATGKWYYEAVRTAYDYGIISGYTDRTFRPNAKITREEAMAMIKRTMDIAKLDTTIDAEETARHLEAFADSKAVSGWAEQAAAVTIKSGIVNGYNGKLAPKDNVTRAETAVMVRNTLKKADLI